MMLYMLYYFIYYKIDGRTILYCRYAKFIIYFTVGAAGRNRFVNLYVRFAGQNVDFTRPPMRTDLVTTTVDVNNQLLNFFAYTNDRIIINRKCVYCVAQKATVILFERMSSPRHRRPHITNGAAAEYTLITFNANTIATV